MKVKIGTKFYLNGHRDNITYYDKGTWVVKVRFAAYDSQLVWRWEKSYAVVQCAALADTDFDIQVCVKQQSSLLQVVRECKSFLHYRYY